jgi:hypothetical protein
MIFAKRLETPGHTRQFTVERSIKSGWIAREQEDAAIHTNLIHDWSRVELAIALFELKALELQREGWLES